MAETKKPLVFRDRDTKEKIPFYVKTEDVELPDGTDIGTKVAELEDAIGNAGDGTVKSVTLNGTTIEPDANGDVELTLPEVEVDDTLDEESGNAVSNAAVTTAIEALRTAIETVIGEGATQAIENFQEVLDFLAGVHDDEALIGLLTAIDGKISGIRANSGKGIADMYSNEDGTVVYILANGDSYTLDLNHEHPQYLKVVDIDEYITAGSNVTITKNQQTGVLTISASGGSGGSQVQADWNESDSTSAAFIKNKPTGVSEFNNDVGYLTSQSLNDRVQSTDVAKIVVLADEAAYNALETKVSSTLYLIPES